MASSFEITYEASPLVLTALRQLGRTEDVRFSPNCRRLALVGFARSVIAVADVEIEMDGRPHVTVTGVTEFSSPRLNGPHGLEFLDDETLIVANRFGDVALFRLPASAVAGKRAELTPIDLPSDRGFEFLDAPGAISIASRTDRDIEVLVCNNDGDAVTRHVLHDDGSADKAVTVNDTLLRHWLNFPDGVAVSPDGVWIAVSNLHRPRVLLYERSSSLNESSDPDGILRGPSHPHGIRFSTDGHALFVADAESPCVFVYLRDGDSWRGVQFRPANFVRVMDEDIFQRGHGRTLGGPKGIDIDRRGLVLAVTCESQPLAFFDVAAILERSAEQVDDRARQVSDELWIQEHERLVDARFHARIAELKGSMSFRITKPLRELSAVWQRVRG